jgi:photosystem II stability/assembly factor-like uncharacterized protein
MKYLIFLLILLTTISPTPAQWQIQNIGTSEDLNDVAILNQTSAVVVGNNGTILKTTNNGNDWGSKNSGTTNHLNAVSFYFESAGIAVGDEVMCKTTDGGDTWSTTYINKNAISVSTLFSVWSGYEFELIGCNDGTILFSTDFGNTWEDTSFSHDPIVASSLFSGFNLDMAYVAAKFYTAHSYLPPSPLSWELFNNSINIEDSLTGGYLYDWSKYLIGVEGFSGTTPLILKKFWTDTSWVIEYSFVPPPYVPKDIVSYSEYNSNQLFVCGSEGKIFNSIDKGVTWSEQFTSTTETLNSITFRFDSIGYSVGENGTILYTSNGGVSSIEDELPITSDFKLEQNYPNPFNPTTKIKFTIPAVETRHASSLQMVSLKIFDILGNEITTLVNDELSPGEYEIYFDAPSNSSFRLVRNLTSGIYFYTLRAGDPMTSSGLGFVQTKKMIYLK